MSRKEIRDTMKSYIRTPILLALAPVFFVACTRTFDGPTVTSPTLSPPEAPTNVHATIQNNGAVSLSWTTTDPAEIKEYWVYVSEDGLDGDFQRRASSVGTAATVNNLVNGRQYFFSISAVGKTGLESVRTPPVTVRVGVLSMAINEDALYTPSPDVSVFFFVPFGAVIMRLSEDSNFTGTAWQEFRANAPFTFSPGDGPRKVFAQIQFENGVDYGSTLRDTIILDTKAVIDSVRNSQGGGVLTVGDIVTFAVYTKEKNGFATVKFSGRELTLYDDSTNGDGSPGDGVYSLRWVVPSGLEVQGASITGTFQDQAGNEAADVQDASVLTVANPPDAVTLSAQALSSGSIRLQWTQSQALDFTAYKVFRGPGPTVTTSNTLIATITTASELILIDDNLSASTTFAYRVFVSDITDLQTGSNTVLEATPPNVAPVASTLAGHRQGLDIVLSWTLNADNDFGSYRLERSSVSNFSTFSVIAVVNEQATTSYTDVAVGAGTFYYRLVIFDKQGLSATSNSATVL